MNINYRIYISLLFELIAFGSIVNSKGFKYVVIFFIFHILASFLISSVIITLVPKKIYKKNSLLLLITFLNALTLIVGYIFSIYMVHYYIKKTKVYKKYPIEYLNTYEISDFPLIKRNLGESIASLCNPFLPKTLKTNIVNKFLFETTEESVHIIRQFINDPDYEIRLYAFHKIMKLKNEITREINFILTKLEQHTNNFALLKKLAFLYWEFYNFGLADEGLLDFYIEKSLYYIDKAFELAYDGELLFLKANIMKIKKDYNTALLLLEKSIKYGMSTHIVYPIIAEIYYEKGNFSEVRRVLNLDRTLKLDFNTSAVAEMWEAI